MVLSDLKLKFYLYNINKSTVILTCHFYNEKIPKMNIQDQIGLVRFKIAHHLQVILTEFTEL